jgi:hypothetical protein
MWSFMSVARVGLTPKLSDGAERRSLKRMVRLNPSHNQLVAFARSKIICISCALIIGVTRGKTTPSLKAPAEKLVLVRAQRQRYVENAWRRQGIGLKRRPSLKIGRCFPDYVATGWTGQPHVEKVIYY